MKQINQRLDDPVENESIFLSNFVLLNSDLYSPDRLKNSLRGNAIAEGSLSKPVAAAFSTAFGAAKSISATHKGKSFSP